MSDAGIHPPCSRIWLSDLAWFIGETSRPMSMGILSTATAAGFLLKLGAGELGVMGTLVASLYGAKVFEKVAQTRADADVKKAGA